MHLSNFEKNQYNIIWTQITLADICTSNHTARRLVNSFLILALCQCNRSPRCLRGESDQIFLDQKFISQIKIMVFAEIWWIRCYIHFNLILCLPSRQVSLSCTLHSQFKCKSWGQQDWKGVLIHVYLFHDSHPCSTI